MDPHGNDSAPRRTALGETFSEIVEKRLARRSFLKGAGAAGALLVAAPALAPRAAKAHGWTDPGLRLRFAPIEPSRADAVEVPAGYTGEVVIRWGDPIRASGPAFDLNDQSGARQARQFGFNCDYLVDRPLPAWLRRHVELNGGRPNAANLAFLGLVYPALLQAPGATRALLFVNHEYTSGSEMFPGYDAANPTQGQVETELEAHGATVLEVRLDAQGKWRVDPTSPFNRRITGTTEIEIVGPAAGHALLQTRADPSGRRVRGMLNNCGGGITPWGTVLTCEENFDQYFANGAQLPAEKAALYAGIAPPSGASERKWERFDARFDCAQEPNEYARFGWIVEVDPYDPGSTPRKHTALGRVKHEGAFTTLARDLRPVVYSGDDARFEYLYKFVARGRYKPWDRAGNLRLLEDGTLHVAKFNADGTGEWLRLVQGEGPLSAANGFPDQATLLVRTRDAADALGATRMDRPEDVDVSPRTGKVYMACTNNSARTSVASDPGEVAANPRLGNRWGHVIEIHEDGDDNGATTFRWEILLLCGDPSVAAHGAYFAGFDPSQVSPIACPDNLEFDGDGNLWIATDGQPNASGFGQNDGIFAVPVEGAERGYLRQFLSSVPGAEVASLKISGDETTLFTSIQHPGEGGGLPNALSAWPDGTNLPPRPSVIAVRRTAGGSKKIGA
jgi:hypothetical protein